MKSGGVRPIRMGLAVVVSIVWLTTGCGLFSETDGDGAGESRGDADATLGSFDATSTLCSKFCSRQSECGLATPDCLAFCSEGERVDLKKCVVNVEDCSGVRDCLGSDTGGAGDVPAEDVGETGLDVRDGTDTNPVDTENDSTGKSDTGSDPVDSGKDTGASDGGDTDTRAPTEDSGTPADDTGAPDIDTDASSGS